MKYALVVTCIILGILLFAGAAQANTVTPADGVGYFSVSYPRATALDWITGVEGSCRVVEFSDVRTVGTVTWNWSFGDGTNSTTTTGAVIHAFPSGAFTVLVKTTDYRGNNQTYAIPVNTIGTSCSSKLFAMYITFPAFLLAVGDGGLAAILSASRKPSRKKLGHRLLMPAIVGIVVFIVAVSYAATIYIPYLS